MDRIPGIAGDTTLRDYLAANAPAVPGWFDRKWETQIVELGAGQRGPRQVEESHEAHFFRWRWYYADAMLSARATQGAK